MDDFLPLYAALAAFFAAHSLPALPGLRGRLVMWLGSERRYLILHSVLASLTLVWLVLATLEAPRIELWGFHDWARWVPILVMPIACILLVAGLTTSNPFSLGPGSRGFDPSRPGIVGITRHPVLLAAALWSGAHLFPNGELRAVLLFGALFVFSLMGVPLFDHRRKALAPLKVALRLGRADLPGLMIRVIGGLLLYGALLYLHQWAFGLNPLSALGA